MNVPECKHLSFCPTGDIEIISNIQPDDRVVLEFHYFPIGVTFLTLVYADGDTNAIVRTNKPLDAEVLSEVCFSHNY